MKLLFPKSLLLKLKMPSLLLTERLTSLPMIWEVWTILEALMRQLLILQWNLVLLTSILLFLILTEPVLTHLLKFLMRRKAFLAVKKSFHLILPAWKMLISGLRNLLHLLLAMNSLLQMILWTVVTMMTSSLTQVLRSLAFLTLIQPTWAKRSRFWIRLTFRKARKEPQEILLLSRNMSSLRKICPTILLTFESRLKISFPAMNLLTRLCLRLSKKSSKRLLPVSLRHSLKKSSTFQSISRVILKDVLLRSTRLTSSRSSISSKTGLFLPQSSALSLHSYVSVFSRQANSSFISRSWPTFTTSRDILCLRRTNSRSPSRNSRKRSVTSLSRNGSISMPRATV